MIRAAVIGNIGSGKTFVAKLFKCPVFNADNEVKIIYRTNKVCFYKLKKLLPNYIKSFPIKKKELIEAIKSRNSENIKEELGDVLLQVIFHSQIALENKEFDFFDVVENLKEKLIRRHPYVFDKSKKHTKEEQTAMWEKIKRKEKGG